MNLLLTAIRSVNNPLLRTILSLFGMALCLGPALNAQQSFREVAEAAGMGVPFSQGVSVVDFDGDGLDDVFISRRTRNNQLFRNQGDGTFVDVARQAGLDHIAQSAQSIWADYDNDGDLDCYQTIDDEPNRLYRNQGNGTFMDVAETAGVATTALNASAIWGDVNGDQLLDLFVFLINDDDLFFLNNGDGTFRNYTAESGIAQERLSMGATFIDFDKDHDLDLYLTHDGHAGNFMYENDGQGHFTDVSEQLDMYTTSEAMGVSVGDFNNDGWPDLYLTNRLENFLFKNNGGTSFTEMGNAAGVDDLGMGWGVSWLDFDNDGLLDLYIANDSYYSDHPNVLYRNLGDETFGIMDAESPISSEKGSYSTAIADLDQNGFPDLLVANRGNVDRSELFINDMENDHQWLVIRLSREQNNLPIIGAEVMVETNLGQHRRYAFSGTSWAADDSKQMLFGLGRAESINQVTVTWPGGVSQTHSGLDFKKAYELTDGGNTHALSYENTPLQLSDGQDPGDVGSVITSLEEEAGDDPELVLSPNPSKGQLTLRLQTHKAGPVQVELISTKGSLIQSLFKKPLPPGMHKLDLALPILSNDFYLVRINVADRTFFKKIMLKN